MNKKTATKIKAHPWEGSYPPSLNWAFKSTEKPVYQILEDAAKKHPQNICADFLGRTYTYEEMMKMANQVAYGLQKIGIKQGDHIGICLPNCPYFIAAYFGALKIGATVVNFNPLYTEEELAYQINDSGVRLMFTINIADIYNKVLHCVGATSLSKVVVCSLPKALPPLKKFLFKLLKYKELAHIKEDTKNIFFSSLIKHGDTPVPAEINPHQDIAVIQYTGGTTGVPKGAMLTHENVSSNISQIHEWLKTGGSINPEGEVFLAALPFFHVFAMTAVMNLAIKTNSKIIMLPRFELEKVVKAIHKQKPTIFPGVPTIFNALNNYAEISHYDLSSLKYCISGGATLPQQIRDTFVDLTGCQLVEGYGLSESSPVATCNPLHNGGKINSIGIPLPGTQVEIRDIADNSKCVNIGEHGELFIKGPQVMTGYWKKADPTKETLIDGWLKTGDVGYMDNDGYIFLTDRLKEIIIVSGYNVYPKVIEEAFYKHPEVEEVIVIGIPDTEKGEVPKAFVKLKSGAKVTEEELLLFTKKHLNPIEKPKEIEFRKELPKTLIGKLSKKELVAEEQQKREQK